MIREQIDCYALAEAHHALLRLEREAKRQGVNAVEEIDNSITVGEAAEIMGRSKDYVCRRIRAGQIKAQKKQKGDRRLWKIDPDSVKIFMEATSAH